MGWPEYTLLGLLCFECGIHAANHGKPRGNFNFFIRLIDCAILIGLLAAGGFFA